MSLDKAITSLQNPSVKMLRSLDAKKYRDEEGLFLVEGARHIAEAFEQGWQAHTLAFSAAALHDATAKQNLALARQQKAQVLEVTDKILGSITNRDNNQPVIAAFRQRKAELSSIDGGFWVALENIRDPGNLGTILRTADAAGAKGVMLLGTTCDPWSPEAIRASMGSFTRMPIITASLEAFAAWRKTYKGRLVGTHLNARAIDYRDTPTALPLVLLMGSEQSGLSDRLTALCDTLVKIPMTGGAESLNLAVSTGIMLYEIARAGFQK